MNSPLNFSPELLDKLKNYNRPVRMVIWVIIISIAFLYLIFVRSSTPIDPLAEVMLIGMFADLSIYGVSRTVEKNIQAKIDGTQGVVDKVADSTKIDTKADIDIKNDS